MFKRMRTGLLVAFVLLSVACTSDPPGADSTVVTVAGSTRTAELPAVQSTEAEKSTPPEPSTAPTISPAVEVLATRSVDTEWGDPENVGAFKVKWIAGVLADSRSLLVIEETGELVEGCEGATTAVGRISLVDLDTGERTVLESELGVEELGVQEARLYLGPRNRLALIAGCDANAWLAAVGTIDADGTLTLNRLGTDLDERVSASNNAGFSVTWTADGEVLFVDATRVDAATGKPLDSPEGESTLRTHAELEDGTRLVSERSTESTDRFWVVEPDAQTGRAPERAPDFSGQAFYPAVRVHIGPAGHRAYATFQDWESDRTWTVIISRDRVRQLPGRAWPSPSGSRLLVRDVDDWTIVDLDTGTRSPIALPANDADTRFDVLWGATDDELLMTDHGSSDAPGTPDKIQRLSTQ